MIFAKNEIPFYEKRNCPFGFDLTVPFRQQ